MTRLENDIKDCVCFSQGRSEILFMKTRNGLDNLERNRGSPAAVIKDCKYTNGMLSDPHVVVSMIDSSSRMFQKNQSVKGFGHPVKIKGHLYGLPQLMGQLGLRLPMAQAAMIVMLLATNNQCTNKTLYRLLLALSLLPS
uniref:Uncharacterized protein n=1 Tax=Tanacetum cinerariifolium TaxID=118510 RepID=A0A699KE24_TANCI|nr:hypothetical protein [Tanacetum cinerariifolium]